MDFDKPDSDEITYRDITPSRLRQLRNEPRDLVSVLVQFKSRVGRKYQLYHVPADEGNYLRLCSLDDDESDYGLVLDNIAFIAMGNPEDYKHDRSNGLTQLIYTSLKLNPSRIAHFVDEYSRFFRDVRIIFAYFSK